MSKAVWIAVSLGSGLVEISSSAEFPVESAGTIESSVALEVESGGGLVLEAEAQFPVESIGILDLLQAFPVEGNVLVAVEGAFPIESGGLPLQPLLLLFDVDEVLNALLFIDFDVLDKELGELLSLELLFDVGDALKPLSLTFDVLDAGLEEAFVGVGGDIQQPVSKVT